MPNYFVIAHGHIAWFGQYEAAVAFAKDFDGATFNLWGLQQAADGALIGAQSAQNGR